MDLDPRAILTHLNNLGYKNVTSEQLKEFIRDLKLLIKYESKYSIEEQSAVNNVNLLSTLIAKCKKKQDDQQKYKSVPKLHKQPDDIRTKKPTIDITINQNIETKSKKIQRQETAHKENRIPLEKDGKSVSSKATQKSSNKKCSGKFIRNTPTDLYQKYKEDWDRFKNFVPGENSRDDVRQAVRRKLQHRPNSESQQTYLCFTNDRKVIKRM